MKTKFSGILTLLLAFVVQLTFAQDKAVSGTVSDESGMPVAGVNIIVCKAHLQELSPTLMVIIASWLTRELF